MPSSHGLPAGTNRDKARKEAVGSAPSAGYGHPCVLTSGSLCAVGPDQKGDMWMGIVRSCYLHLGYEKKLVAAWYEKKKWSYIELKNLMFDALDLVLARRYPLLSPMAGHMKMWAQHEHFLVSDAQLKRRLS